MILNLTENPGLYLAIVVLVCLVIVWVVVLFFLRLGNCKTHKFDPQLRFKNVESNILLFNSKIRELTIKDENGEYLNYQNLSGITKPLYDVKVGPPITSLYIVWNKDKRSDHYIADYTYLNEDENLEEGTSKVVFKGGIPSSPQDIKFVKSDKPWPPVDL